MPKYLPCKGYIEQNINDGESPAKNNTVIFST